MRKRAGGCKIKVKGVQEEIEASDALCCYIVLRKQASRFAVVEKEREFAEVSSAQLPESNCSGVIYKTQLYFANVLIYSSFLDIYLDVCSAKTQLCHF